LAKAERRLHSDLTLLSWVVEWRVSQLGWAEGRRIQLEVLNEPGASNVSDLTLSTQKTFRAGQSASAAKAQRNTRIKSITLIRVIVVYEAPHCISVVVCH